MFPFLQKDIHALTPGTCGKEIIKVADEIKVANKLP